MEVFEQINDGTFTEQLLTIFFFLKTIRTGSGVCKEGQFSFPHPRVEEMTGEPITLSVSSLSSLSTRPLGRMPDRSLKKNEATLTAAKNIGKR